MYVFIYIFLYLSLCLDSPWFFLCLVTWDSQDHLHIPLSPFKIVCSPSGALGASRTVSGQCPSPVALFAALPDGVLWCCPCSWCSVGRLYSFSRAKVEPCQNVTRNLQNIMRSRSQKQKVTVNDSIYMKNADYINP